VSALPGEAQVCVIGAGILGASAALHLAERGLDVLLLDRSEAGLEASGANAGTLAVQNKQLAAIPFAMRAVKEWQGLGERLGMDVEYEKRGGFRVAHSEDDVKKLEASVAAQRSVGAPVEMVYPPRLFSEAPYLDPQVRAASYCPEDGMANPLAAARAFLRAARAAGARIVTQCGVRQVRPLGDHQFVLETVQGPIRCQTVLAAAGAWIGDVARTMGVVLPITSEVLQALITDFGDAIFPHVVTHVRGDLTLKQQRRTGKVLIGGAWNGEGDRGSGTKRLRRENIVGNLRRAVDTVPAIRGTRLLRAWVGFEGRTPDKLFVAGSVGRPRGFHVLGCASGGFTMSPMAGWLAAEHITGGPGAAEWKRFDVDRFLGERNGTDAVTSGNPTSNSSRERA
jgi:glycine/D-amino acid oxidase-like deaminating enzyme